MGDKPNPPPGEVFDAVLNTAPFVSTTMLGSHLNHVREFLTKSTQKLELSGIAFFRQCYPVLGDSLNHILTYYLSFSLFVSLAQCWYRMDTVQRSKARTAVVCSLN